MHRRELLGAAGGGLALAAAGCFGANQGEDDVEYPVVPSSAAEYPTEIGDEPPIRPTDTLAELTVGPESEPGQGRTHVEAALWAESDRDVGLQIVDVERPADERVVHRSEYEFTSFEALWVNLRRPSTYLLQPFAIEGDSQWTHRVPRAYFGCDLHKLMVAIGEDALRSQVKVTDLCDRED